MACDRGRWFGDQIPVRLGAWLTSVGAGPSVTWVSDSGFFGGAAGAASNWRVVEVKLLLGKANWRVSLCTVLNLVADMVLFGLTVEEGG